mgnify:CR=1 FL=1
MHDLKAVSTLFDLRGDFVHGYSYGSGHINDTYCIWVDQAGQRIRYILQRVNHNVFKQPIPLMENVKRVTDHALKRLKEEQCPEAYRRTLTLVPSVDGKPYALDSDGNCWRVYPFIERARTYDQIETTKQCQEAARAFGEFQKLTADLPGEPLFETILEYIPAPEADVDQPFQMLVSSIDYNEFVGRIAIGRIERGTLKQNQEIMVCNYHDPDATPKKAKAVSIYEFEGLARKQVTESTAGNIIAMSGIPDITIGDTVCAPGAVEPLPFVKISAPTLEMTFSVNDSPYAGREGKFVTSRQLRDRLYRETLKDVSLKVSDTDRDSAFNVAGRGEMSLSILIETMRREGYEFQVSPPRVLYKEIDGKKCEPIERLVVDVPGDCVGSVIEKLGQRKGDLVEMTPVGDRMKVEFLIPARGLFGYRNDFLTDTKGEGIMASVFDSYAPYKGDISRRGMGSLISTETGDSITYGLFNAQERGTLFIGAGVPVYEGMIIGVANRGEDIVVNACRKKQLTNTRASGSDDALRLVPPRQMSLEQCLEFLADDELLEVTPKSLRMRKAILNHEQRMKSLKGKK